MTFPMQNLYQAEMEYEKDLERMKELYPKEIADISAMVAQHCDELEFEGSRIYDENPDRMMMEREVQALYGKIREHLKPEPEMKAAEAEAEDMPEPQVRDERMEAFSLIPPSGWRNLEQADIGCESCGQRRYPVQNGCNDWLCSIVGVLFQNEIYGRRCRYRRCKRWW